MLIEKIDFSSAAFDEAVAAARQKLKQDKNQFTQMMDAKDKEIADLEVKLTLGWLFCDKKKTIKMSETFDKNRFPEKSGPGPMMENFIVRIA